MNWTKSKRECTQVGSPNQTSSKHELSLDELREIHSNAMGPVLEELKPQLKLIRDRLNSLKLKKEPPKARRGKVIAVRKESSTADTVPIEDSLGKAGKSVHPILVGETSNLYKTRLIHQSKTASHVTVLDLHGCSKAEARAMLQNGLKEWYNMAMKGEFPFVIPVNIICGRGNQILSEFVAQFIRETPQIANRPKGTLQ